MEMTRITIVVALSLAASAASAVELPLRTFYSGNDIYGFCQHDRGSAFTYVAGLYDQAAHASLLIDHFRYSGNRTPQRDAEVDFQLRSIVGYCTPPHATLKQITDVFCKYLKDSPEKRDGLPSILFSDALTQAWPCPGN